MQIVSFAKENTFGVHTVKHFFRRKASGSVFLISLIWHFGI